ncbi:polysaccharide deacetylase family protein [Vulgatibacter sp.]|uniref:polysaccharide deacetylase family protein n=1 Tax=Vulgatibacter sp. TaxID=1971226 RepID=UPI0035680E4B
MQKLACVTINLQGLPHLCRRVGVDERSLAPAGAGAVTRRAPERYAELLDRKGVPATFFTIGEDLEDGPSAMAIGELFRLGHELGTHGWSGDRDLAARPAGAIRDELERAAAALEGLGARKPAGFRSPGETISATLLGILEEQGYLYDASVNPSPPLWLHRAARRRVHRAEAAGERPDSPALLLAPREPYRPSPRDPYRRGSSKLVELPVATVPISRLPFSGAFLASLPKAAVATLYRAVRFRDFLAIELQGYDLLDESDGASPELSKRRSDLRVPAATKRQRLSELLDWLKNDFEMVTLEEAAARLAPRLR